MDRLRKAGLRPVRTIPLPQFKNMVKRNELPGAIMLHKQNAFTIDPLQDRRIRFTISTGTVDRQGDTVAVAGWDLVAFSRNPVVLWGHQADLLPIGRCIDIGSDGKALRAVVEFVDASVPIAGEMAEACYQLCRTGVLSATSVGFRPIEVEIAKDRDDDDSWWAPLNFLRQELLELSIVTIPANPDALIDPAYSL